MAVYKMSVEEMCSSLGWNITDLSREARINPRTAAKAYNGEEPAQRTKRDICTAFSEAFGREVLISEIAWFVTH